MIKLAIIFNSHKLSGKLTKFFTGCYAYHAFWVDIDGGKMYDMHWIRRRRLWPHYSRGVELFDAHCNITGEYLESQLDTDDSIYGWKDYTLFLMRPLFHLFGKSTINAGGVICSEMVNDDIWRTGGITPWRQNTPPPSPCDLYRWLKEYA